MASRSRMWMKMVSTSSKKTARPVVRRKPQAKYFITASRDMSNLWNFQCTSQRIRKAWQSVARSYDMKLYENGKSLGKIK